METDTRRHLRATGIAGPVLALTFAVLLGAAPQGATAQEADPVGTWTLQTMALADQPTRGVRPALLRVEEADGGFRAEITSIRNQFVPVQEFRFEAGTMFVRFTAFEYELEIEGNDLWGEVTSPAGAQEVTGFRQEEGVFLYGVESGEFETVRTGILGHRVDGAPPEDAEDPAEWVRSRVESVEDVAIVVRGNIRVGFVNAQEFEEELIANLGREADVHGVWVGDRLRIDHLVVEGDG